MTITTSDEPRTTGRDARLEGHVSARTPPPSRCAGSDRTWAAVRKLPLLAKPVVWIAFLPWLSGLAVWESDWRTPRARRLLVLLIAAAFIVFWASTTFQSGGG